MIDNLLIVVPVFPMRILISLSIDEILLLRYVDWSLNFRLVGWLFGFYNTSTFVGYLTLNQFLYKRSVLFQTIQFSMSTQFNCKKKVSFSNYSV